MKGSAVMEGLLHGGPWWSQEMVLVFGFSEGLIRVRTAGHCERVPISWWGGGGGSNIFPREILILFAIVLEISSLSPGKCSIPIKEEWS